MTAPTHYPAVTAIDADDIVRLEAALATARLRLAADEATLAEEQTAVTAFIFQFQKEVGPLVDAFEKVRGEVDGLMARLQRLRRADEGPDEAGNDDEWAPPPPRDDAPPVDPDEARRLKRLYRRLARRFHPDYASSDADRGWRTGMMAIVNNAYRVGDITALEELLAGAADDFGDVGAAPENQAAAHLRLQLQRVRLRQHEVTRQIEKLRSGVAARLWRESMQIQGQGRDWLIEMAGELRRKLLDLRAERDFLKVQFDQMDEDEW